MKSTPGDGINLAAAHNNRSSQLTESGGFEGAMTCFLEVLGHAPENLLILCNRGFASMNLRKYAAAINDLIGRHCRRNGIPFPAYTGIDYSCPKIFRARKNYPNGVFLSRFVGETYLP